MVTFLRGVGWLWVFAVWLGACVFSAQAERYGWLLLWIFMPPFAWLGEVFMGLLSLIISFGPHASTPTWAVVVGLVFIAGWIVPFAIAFVLEHKKNLASSDKVWLNQEIDSGGNQ